MTCTILNCHRERQQQLEELRKNLEKVQEEADILRSQLRSVQKSAQVCVLASHNKLFIALVHWFQSLANSIVITPS